jgi:hypothetical protein
MSRALHHLKSDAVAYVALFVALGGTGYAAFSLPPGSVGTRALKNHSVSAVKLDRGSIAGYVRDWARIDSQGRLTSSRPRAHVVVWRNSGPEPGGLIEWDRPIPSACFALATTEILPQATVSYSSAQVASGGSKHDGQAYLLLSSAQKPVDVTVICPQP